LKGYGSQLRKEAVPKKCGIVMFFLARVLTYLETPQYLRKFLFPIHKDLSFAGLLTPLDAPHHQRQDEECPYREGIVMDRPVSQTNPASFVQVGLLKEVKIDRALKPDVRVTVKMTEYSKNKSFHKGQAVSRTTPRDEAGIYWGYDVRLAQGLSAVFQECPLEGGYDVKIAISEKGKNCEETDISEIFKTGSFKHLLVVVGGSEGIGTCVENDPKLRRKSVEEVFDVVLNTCPYQGSRTMRTEEAILIAMAYLSPKMRIIQKNN